MASSFKLSAIFLVALTLAISSSPLTLACGSCPSPKTPSPKTPKRSPITVPPISGKPPITVPPVIGKPPITLPPGLPVPPITVPPIIGKPPIILPPVTMPPVTVPPIIGGGTPPATGTSSCPPPPMVAKTCPVDTLKLGACLDLLGQNVQLGDPAVTCCAPLAGLAGLDAALCLCTTIKANLLDINVLLPLALQVLANTCGKSIPPGYTCP